MLRLIFSILVLLIISQIVAAQAQRDVCHVYLIDSEAAQKAADAYDNAATEEEKARLISGGVKILGEFSPKVREEELTTKTFAFPGSNLFITASVFYTDEMMASSNTSDSMLLGLVVADKAQENALSATNNVVAEVTYNEFDTVRVKTNVKIKGRTFLVGLQCNQQRRPTGK